LKISFFILIISFLLSCSKPELPTPALSQSKKNGNQTIPVVTKTSKTANLQITLSTTGQSVALQTNKVSLKKSGYIANIRELEGRHIKKGAVVLSLQNVEEQIALSEAKSSLLKQLTEFGINYPNPDSALAIIVKAGIFSQPNNGTSSLSEIDNGFFQKVLSGEKQQEVRLAQSGLLDALNAYRRAQLNYEQTFFKAPFSGYIANIEYKSGQWLPAGTAACALVDISKIRVVCDVLESESGQVKMGAMAHVTFPALGDASYALNMANKPRESAGGNMLTLMGKVTEINPVIDLEKHTMRVTIEIDNPGHKIKPGMLAEVKITTQTLKDRLIVPKKAIVIRDNRELVFVVRDSLAQWCYVTTGATEFGDRDSWVEIISSEFGLKAGEPVVTEGHFSLAHNAKVSISNNK
jgi:RND family efflux transporter MFP subunit